MKNLTAYITETIFDDVDNPNSVATDMMLDWFKTNTSYDKDYEKYLRKHIR